MDGQQSGLLGRVAYLDGLRAVAVLLVLADHAVGRTTLATAGWAAGARALREGAHGVDLFFVLSGFCLSYPLLHKLRQNGLAALKCTASSQSELCASFRRTTRRWPCCSLARSD